jgi:hypothetical protein
MVLHETHEVVPANGNAQRRIDSIMEVSAAQRLGRARITYELTCERPAE